MTGHLRLPVVLATIAGLAVALWAIGRVGLAALAHAALMLGPGGFLTMCLCTLALLTILGGAWLAAMPGEPIARLPLFAWARTVREGANDLLPFSQIGGLVVGARTLTGAGLPAARVYAAMIVDLSTEMASQLAFTLYGLAVLGSILFEGKGMHHVTPLAWAGAGVTLAITAAFILLQRPMLKLAVALAGRMLPGAHVPLDQVVLELDAIYRRRGAVLVSFLLNLAGWIVAGAIAALTLRLMGQPLPLWRVMALESLIFAIRGAAFLIPGAIGVQEAGYLLLAQAMGLDPQAAVALSLVKRARDAAIGLPALLVWQARQLRPAAMLR
ncbi:MAG TPA: lysylphosphatidylglycerol synthase domain-containing protein [Sphingomonas sp.]